MADRYTYVPLTGLFSAVVWLAEELTRSWRGRRVALPAAGIAITVALFVLTRAQAGYWRTSETLLEHNAARPNCFEAREKLANYFVLTKQAGL